MQKWVIYFAGIFCLSEDSSVPANGQRQLPVFFWNVPTDVCASVSLEMYNGALILSEGLN